MLELAINRQERIEKGIGQFIATQFLIKNRYRRVFAFLAVLLMTIVTLNVLIQDNMAAAESGKPGENGLTENDWIIEDGDTISRSSEEISTCLSAISVTMFEAL